jgi:hypothetical protein
MPFVVRQAAQHWSAPRPFAKRTQMKRGMVVVGQAFERGIEFIDKNGGGPGVRLRSSPSLWRVDMRDLAYRPILAIYEI